MDISPAYSFWKLFFVRYLAQFLISLITAKTIYMKTFKTKTIKETS